MKLPVNGMCRVIRQMETFTEAIRLSPGVYLQASPQKFRLHRLLSWEVAPSIETLQETGDANVTRQMMAGAFYAGLRQCAPDEKIADDSVTITAPSLLRTLLDEFSWAMAEMASAS
jgi:hypothetical protein